MGGSPTLRKRRCQQHRRRVSVPSGLQGHSNPLSCVSVRVAGLAGQSQSLLYPAIGSLVSEMGSRFRKCRKLKTYPHNSWIDKTQNSNSPSRRPYPVVDDLPKSRSLIVPYLKVMKRSVPERHVPILTNKRITVLCILLFVRITRRVIRTTRTEL